MLDVNINNIQYFISICDCLLTFKVLTRSDISLIKTIKINIRENYYLEYKYGLKRDIEKLRSLKHKYKIHEIDELFDMLLNEYFESINIILTIGG